MNTLWAIPGFMGLLSDWDLFEIENLKGFNLFSFSWQSQEEWGKKFNDFIRKESPKNNILLGYSLGGRLALHALLDDPSLWKGAIFVSAHPGIADPNERKIRVLDDEKWAKLFLNEEWNSLMQKWNDRPVFKNETFDFKRQEKDFCRKELAYTLRYASQGKQQNLKSQIEAMSVPQLWLVGEKDKRYLEMSKTLSLKCPKSKIISLPHASHRLPWSHPEDFNKIVREWCHNI